MFTKRGQMARYASSLRPRWSPIFAVCETRERASELVLLRGVTPLVMPTCLEDPNGTVLAAMKLLQSRRFLKAGDSVVVILPHGVSTDGLADTIKMYTV